MKEVKEIIEKYFVEDREKCFWDNVGFVIDKGIIWVDKYRMCDIINIFFEDYLIYFVVYIYE